MVRDDETLARMGVNAAFLVAFVTACRWLCSAVSDGGPNCHLAVTLVAGVVLAARWLPGLGKGRADTLAFWVTCGLAGIAVSLVGVHIYEIIRQLDNANLEAVANSKPDIVATGIIDTLAEVGPIVGLSAVVYLLAPAVSRALTQFQSPKLIRPCPVQDTDP